MKYYFFFAPSSNCNGGGPAPIRSAGAGPLGGIPALIRRSCGPIAGDTPLSPLYPGLKQKKYK